MVYVSFFVKVKTECAKIIKFDEFIDAEALIVRDEVPLNSSCKHLKVLCNDGSKVALNQTIAKVYDSESAITDDIEKSSTISLKTIDVDNINRDINNRIRSMIHNHDNCADIESIIKLKEQIFEKKSVNFYDLQKKSNENIPDSNSEIKSDCIGIFSSFTDGFEDILSSSMNDENIKNLKIVDYIHKNKQENIFGKIITSDNCIILCYIDKEFDLQGTQYYIKFELNSEEMPCNLMRILELEDKKIALFSSNINRFLVNSRVESAKIKTRSATGIKVNKKYMRTQDNQNGVFVLDRKTVKFKSLNPVYENNEFIISYPDEQEKNTVDENDLIITSGENLYDGKVLLF